ncbi:hypothetical protein F5B17DRAFT_284236 [Nemania serpens]|nr:hypothetical protein F5B17DRAFT_284236 [Nemania serpens]
MDLSLTETSSPLQALPDTQQTQLEVMATPEPLLECQTCLANSRIVGFLSGILEELDDFCYRTQQTIADFKPCELASAQRTPPEKYEPESSTFNNIDGKKVDPEIKEEQQKCPHPDCSDSQKSYSRLNNLERHFATHVDLEDERCLLCQCPMPNARKYIYHFKNCKEKGKVVSASPEAFSGALKRRESIKTTVKNLLEQYLNPSQVKQGQKRYQDTEDRSPQPHKIRVSGRKTDRTIAIIQDTDNDLSLADCPASSTQLSLPLSKNDIPGHLSSALTTTDSNKHR